MKMRNDIEKNDLTMPVNKCSILFFSLFPACSRQNIPQSPIWCYMLSFVLLYDTFCGKSHLYTIPNLPGSILYDNLQGNNIHQRTILKVQTSKFSRMLRPCI